MPPKIPFTKEFFEEKIEMIPECGCWIWMGLCNNKKEPYGVSCFSGKKLAHRAAWELYRGPIPKDMNVLHKCDTTLCVNPFHLFLGTQKDNIADCINKKRFILGEINGQSKLSVQDVKTIRADTRPQRDIARDFKVHQVTISKIKLRERWKHI